MSKLTQKTTKTNASSLPKLGKIQTAWNLKKHFYTSEKDPQIAKDLDRVEKAFMSFEETYRATDFTANEEILFEALVKYEALMALTAETGSKVGRYFSFRQELNSKDSVAEKQGNLIDDRLTKMGNRTVFFTLALGKIPKEKQEEYLQSLILAPYRYYLMCIFLDAKYTLSEPEERILNLKSATSYGMWTSATSKILSNRVVKWKGKSIAIPEALEVIDVLPSKEKQSLWNLILTEMEKIAEFAENEFNAIVTDKKVNDELRGYSMPYSATIQSYENDEKAVLALVEAISTKGFALSKKFYKLKAKYHQKKTIPYINKYDSIGKARKISFEEAVEICRETFYGVKKEYGEIFDRMLRDGQIDVFPKAGKRGGAFMSNAALLPTFVFLNHTENFKSLETLAHEMGHAIHAERSKQQPLHYQGFSTVTAETASTFFENLVYNKILKDASGKEREILIHDRITRDIATIERQIAFFNFELELHTKVRSQGAVTKEELRKMMQKHLKSYLGEGVEVTERDGESYVYIPHFRYGFYVYSYTYGMLMSTLMAERLMEDPKYIDKIDLFLSSGGNDTVENIFKSIGLDATKTETFLKGLASHERDIKEFEKILAQK